MTSVTNPAPLLVEPTDVVESLAAATVVAPVPAAVVEEKPAAVAEDTPAEVVEDTPAEVVEDTPTKVVEDTPAESEATPAALTPVAATPVAATPIDEVPVEGATLPSTPVVIRPPTVPELRAQAKALGLTGYSRLPKAELLRVIAEHHAK